MPSVQGSASSLNCPAIPVLEFRSIENESQVVLPWVGGGGVHLPPALVFQFCIYVLKLTDNSTFWLIFSFFLSLLCSMGIFYRLISISMIFSLAESSPLMSPSKAILTSITMVLLSIISFWFILRYFVSAYITHLSSYLIYFPWEFLTVITVILNSLFDNYKIFVISESGSDACFVS